MSNKKVVERVLLEVWNKGQINLVDELFAKDFVDHDPHNPFAAEKGPAGYKKLVAMYLEAFPNTTFTIRDQIESGEKVVTRWTAQGTHKGNLMGAIPATGKDVEISGMIISRIHNDQLVESWGNWDMLGMLQQLGVVPKMG